MLHFFPRGACALVVQKEKNMHVCMCVHYSDAASAENYERVMNARQSRKLHLEGHLLCQRLIHSARLLHDRNLHWMIARGGGGGDGPHQTHNTHEFYFRHTPTGECRVLLTQFIYDFGEGRANKRFISDAKTSKMSARTESPCNFLNRFGDGGGNVSNRSYSRTNGPKKKTATNAADQIKV